MNIYFGPMQSIMITSNIFANLRIVLFLMCCDELPLTVILRFNISSEGRKMAHQVPFSQFIIHLPFTRADTSFSRRTIPAPNPPPALAPKQSGVQRPQRCKTSRSRESWHRRPSQDMKAPARQLKPSKCSLQIQRLLFIVDFFGRLRTLLFQFLLVCIL